MVEMHKGRAVNPRKVVRGRVRLIGWLLIGGALLLAFGPLYAYLGFRYSGRLALAQQVAAVDIERGMDFGPVYLEQNQPGRYFISAQLPQCPQGYWLSRFEVLDARKVPVFGEDEVRFIGDFQFRPGEHDSFLKDFTLNKQTGYYYFRFRSLNGSYDSDPAAAPVLAFAIRQRVLTGPVLWIPAAGAMLLGTLLVLVAVRSIRQLAVYVDGLEHPEEEREAVQRAPQAPAEPPRPRISFRQRHPGIPWTEPQG